MAGPDIVLSVMLLSLGGAVVGAGLWRLDRQDRLRLRAARQSRCRWHRWEALAEDPAWLVCALCGKRCRRLNPREERGEPSPSEHLFP
jgi:hypothetical protein